MVLCLIYLFPVNNVRAKTYVTWENMEIDKCASAWLIQRFIDKNATFEFVPKGELITRGIPFDVPEAEIRRYHNLSTFGYLLKKHRLTDPALHRIGEIIHDIEINYWGKKRIDISETVNGNFRQMMMKAQMNPEKILERGVGFFDKMYQQMSE